MKNARLLSAAVCLSAAFIGSSAFAADMAVKALPVVAPFSWTGFYIGGNVGYAVEQNTWTQNFSQPGTDPNTPSTGSQGSNSFMGGVQGGYNWQLAPRWVVGVEGDWDSINISNSSCRMADRGNCVDGGNNNRGALSFNEKSDWLASVRGRVGYVWNGFLAYGTGGAAWGKVDTTLNASCLVGGCGNNAVANATGAAFSNNISGYVAGAGIEGQVWGNWTARLEWLHYGLSGPSNAFTSSPTTGSYTVSWKQDNFNYDTVRFALNYKIW